MADFSISAELKANASNFVSELKKGETSVGNFGNVVEKILGPKGKLVMALAAATAAAVKFGQAMNASMSEIAKGTGKTGEELYKLRENVHDALVEGVARSAKEVGTMIADLNTRFGVTGNEVVQLTKQFDKFAKVTDTDTKTAINLTADAMAKWNIQVEDTDKLLDQLTKASQESGASVTDLLNGLKSGQAVFSQFGMSATDTIAFMGALKQNGIESSQALVAMKTALANFANAGIDAQEGFTQVSEAIRNATSQTEALSIATSTFGARNGAEMVKVLQSGALSADEFKNKLMEAGGAVERTHKAARKSKEAIAELGSALSGTFGGLAEGLDELFKGIIDSVTSIVRALSPIIRPIMNVIRDLLNFIGSLAAEIANFAGDNMKNQLGFKSLTSSLQSTYETIHNILGNVLEVFKATFGLVFSIMNGQWELAWLNMQKIGLTMVKTILDLISDFLNGIKDQINGFIKKVINPFIEKVNFVEEKLGREKTAKMNIVEDFDLSKFTGITEKVNEVNSKIKKASKQTTKEIEGDLGKVKNAIEDLTKQTKNFVTGMKSGLKKIGGEYTEITDKTEAFNTVLFNVGETVTTVIASAFADTFKELGKELAEGGVAWENMAAIALEGISEILNGLGEQLLALSAARAANYDYGTAAMAAAGAAAAFVASGVLSAIASAMKKSAEAAKEAAENFEAFLKQLESWTSASGVSDYITNIAEMNNQLSVLQDTYETWIYILRESDKKFIKNVGFANYLKLLKTAPAVLNTVVPEIIILEKAIKDYSDTVVNNITEANNAIEDQIEAYDALYIYGTELTRILTSEIKGSLLSVALNLRSDLTSIGTDIGEMLTDGIINGATEKDFLSELEDYLRKNVIKIAVYTEGLAEDLSEVGAMLVSAITGGDKESAKIAKENLSRIWDEAKKRATEAEEFLSDIFDNIQSDIDDIIVSVGEIGESIADSLIDGLSNGLSEGEFMETMKSYIKKMIVTSVVYTETLQAEISAIGEAISNGIKDGFSETGLDEIRRDLSYIWYNANTAVGTIDNILNNAFSGYATGTNNATAGLHLVGEAGPELVRFNGGEQVFNAGETREMLSSGMGGNNFNVTFQNMQDTSAYAMMSQLKQWQREMAINGII